MHLLMKEVNNGTIRPLIAGTFPLDRAVDAHHFIHTRANIGKVVLTC
jgi:NADPH:quinone reductase-like Zn-dependent oxidoreductase